MIPVNRPLISESDIATVTSDLHSTFVSGDAPPVKTMEDSLAKTVGTKHAVAFSTGTTAIDLLIEALNIQPGDHCILPDFTIVSTVSNLVRKGASIEFIDADPVTWSINAELAASAIRANTKLIFPVHIYGLPADIDVIKKGILSSDTILLEDAAEALGVTYKGRNCGSLGDAGVFSFFANKIVTGGEGGAVTTNNQILADRLRSLRNLSHSKTRFVHESLSWNARMPALSASLIGSQLKRLDDLVKMKRDIATIYLNGLVAHPWFDIMTDSVPYAKNSYWVVPLLLNSSSPYDADGLQKRMAAEGIDTRRFFCPMHLQPRILEKFKLSRSDYPVSENLWKRGLYLPSGLGNTFSEIETVIDALWKITHEKC